MADSDENKVKGRKRRAIIKFIIKTLISAVILIILAVAAGVLYTWYVGQQDNSKYIDKAKEPVVTKTTVKAPVQQAANAKASASVQSLTSPVNPGSNAGVTVRTNPEATCKITVVYNKIASKDSGLVDKKADEYGMVDWTWTVEESVPVGKWPVTVTCSLDEKRSAVVVGDLIIELPKSQ